MSILSHYSILCFSFNSYSNALSFKGITYEKILIVEQYVRDDLMNKINQICQRDSVLFDDKDKQHFFGIYDTEPEKFRFRPGDVDLIAELVRRVNEKLAQFGEVYYSSKGGKTTNRDTVQMSVGSFFARKEKTLEMVVASSGQFSMNEEEVKSDLFDSKAKPILQSARDLKSLHSISDSIVQIIKGTGKYSDKIWANVQCVFCSKSKHIRIQCIQPQNSNVCYWNLSNFKKHIDCHRKPQPENCAMENNEYDEDDKYEAEFSAMAQKYAGPVVRQNLKSRIRKRKPSTTTKGSLPKKSNDGLDSNADLSEDSLNSNSSDIILSQMMTQNIFNISATLRNGDKTEFVQFKFNDRDEKVKVANVKRDGSCFFGSVAHQLYGSAINSTEHDEQKTVLRAEVIKHMQTHFEQFRFNLQGRVYEHSNGIVETEELENECRNFLNTTLTLPTCYAGAESVNAISQIKKVNILTISEHGDCYHAVGFNESFDRTLFLAHRLNSTCVVSTEKPHNAQRDHYDSVSEFDSSVLMRLADFLNAEKKQKQAKKMNENNNSIISITDTTL